MPIHPENRSRYPADWPLIRERIAARSGGRCECRGECGHDHARENGDWISAQVVDPIELDLQPTRCIARNGNRHPATGSRVVLTVAHRDHTPENCEEDNLFHGCQRCHLAYDKDHHIAERKRRAHALNAAGDLFEARHDD